jgi:uncharacterized protein
MTDIRCGLVLVMAALMAGCATPPATRFYTLLPPANATAMPPVGEAAFELLPVRVPSQVDVPQLVVRRSNGEFGVLETHQWVAPLPDELRLALSAALVAALDQQDLYRLARPEALPVTRVQVELRRFEARPGAGVDLQALWSVRPAEGEALSCAGGARATAAGEGIGGLVEGYQQALQTLAVAIAASVRNARC